MITHNDSILNEADYFISTHSTIRDTAYHFNVSKSKIHNDLTKRLKYINIVKYNAVESIINDNINDRAMRGGLSTKRKHTKNRSEH